MATEGDRAEGQRNNQRCSRILKKLADCVHVGVTGHVSVMSNGAGENASQHKLLVFAWDPFPNRPTLPRA